jgi:hypothetical protein
MITPMNELKVLIVIILIIYTLPGCEKKTANQNEINIDQKILFQYYYVNFAWVYQHSGFIIDNEGNTHCFNLPDNWIFPDSSGAHIDEQTMDHNMMETDSICFVLDKEELLEKFNLIEEAATGNISEPVNIGADQGATVYSAFIYNSEDKKYKHILLKQFGDWRIYNSSQAAIDLCNWLDSIYYEIWYNK